MTKNSEEIKIVFTGTVGAGKTTAISAISDIQTVRTEAKATDETAKMKETTTVGMDYGEVAIDDELVLRIYGTPGQRRFSHMWDILAKGALGFVILIDNSRTLPLSDLSVYLDNFKPYIEKSGAVIGINKYVEGEGLEIDDYYQYLADRGEMYPVMTTDIRQREDVLMLLDSLFTTLEV